MRTLFISFIFILLVHSNVEAQDVPNFANGALSPNAGAASKSGSVPVNYFTGMPNITVPIYSYQNANSGLNLHVSIDYFSGGIRVGEESSSVGLGWSLNAGGSITRIVRGMPDDIPLTGFLYSSAIPTDFRTNASTYYYDSLDTQPDIFQFNCPGGSGKFYLGKNGQIAIVPTSKIKVIPTFQTATLFEQTLKSFRIITEDGTKYDFGLAETSKIDLAASAGFAPMPCGYFGKYYASAWHLTQIISAFNTDTIKLNYVSQSINSGFAFPEILFLNSSGGFKPAVPPGSALHSVRKISSIDFPGNVHVNFLYSNNTKYTEGDYALSKIKISDTAFRSGFLLEYQDTYEAANPNRPEQMIVHSSRLLLKKVVPYTLKQKQDGYSFSYTIPFFPPLDNSTIKNDRDHWGFYNKAENGDTIIPNVAGFTGGANREADFYYARANSLASVTFPNGGKVNYGYELNDRYPYLRDSLQVQFQAISNTQNNIVLNQVFNLRHQLTFKLDRSIPRTGTSPVSGPGGLNCFLKSLDGSITYASTTLSLNNIYYSGLLKWTFNLPNGTYRLETQISPGTSISGSFIINANWENKTVNSSLNAIPSGGIRVASISQFAGSNVDEIPVTIQRIKYVLENGKSSGFLGEVPRYDYPFREVVNYNGTTITDYSAISSEPVSSMDYAQGSIVGYSRVELIAGGNSLNKSLGKTVYEFTDLVDLNADAHTSTFPYAPVDYKSWGIGLPKRISVYDSAGILQKRTINTYGFTPITFSSDFKSLKLGHSATTYQGDRNNVNTPKIRTFIGEEYYPTGGRVYLIATKDSLLQANGSVNWSEKSFQYDANFNIKKIVSNYDRNRGLLLEQRIYYPYDYTLGGAIGKLRDSAILTIPISTENWITGDANPRLLSAASTSFKQISNNSIKPDTLFSFESNKPVGQSIIGVFNPSVLNRSLTYFKPQAKVDQYDSRGNVLETRNLPSGISNTVIMDYGNLYPVAKISNATGANVAYSSFEADGSGNWTIASALRDVSASITGKKSYNLSNGNISKPGLTTSKNYLVTLWAKIGAVVNINGTSINNPIATQLGWNLYQVALNNISTVTISGSGLIDELRIHPKEANMETSTYDPMIGITTSIDANNTIVYNEYDELGRVKLIRDKEKNIIKRYEYSDALMPINENGIWQGYGRECSSGSAIVDSLYRDINPFSDSTGMVKRVYQGLDCTCPGAINNPKYKTVYGQCEEGVWAIVSSVNVKINYQWVWRCTYRYCFSDGSQSTYYEQVISPTFCPITCVIPL